MNPQTSNIISPAVQNNEQDSTKWQGIINALGQANKAISKNYSPFVFYILILLAVEVLIVVFIKRPILRISSLQLANLVDAITAFLFIPYLTRYELALAQGTKVQIKQLFSLSFRTYFNVYVTILIFIPIIVVGALLVLVPLIWILPWFYLVLYPVVDLNYTPVQALKYVRVLLKNNLRKAWAIIGLNFLISFLILLALPKSANTYVNGIVTLLFETTAAILYLWLKRRAVIAT